MIEVRQQVVGRSIPFHRKVAATHWLRSQGYAKSGCSWVLGDCLANWVQVPGREPAGLVVVSQRRGCGGV